LQAAYLIELKWANSVSQSLWYSGLEISYKHLSTPHTDPHTYTHSRTSNFEVVTYQ